MTRSRASAKAAGSRFERQIADGLSVLLGDDRIDRKVRNGAFDKGDIAGVRTADNRRLTIECKDYAGRLEAGTWIREAEREAINDAPGAIPVVIAKRRGHTDPADQFVIMTVAALAELLRAGKEPE